MEEEMLELRLRLSKGVVDYHIIGESIFTMAGTLKPLYLYNMRKQGNLREYFDNVVHIVFGAGGS